MSALRLWCAGLVLGVVGVAEAGVRVIGYDSIAAVGSTVTVGAKVEGSGWGFWRPDVRGVNMEFAVNGLLVYGTTDDDGVARATAFATAVGEFPIDVLRVGHRDTGQGTLYVLDPSTPIAIVDIDGTLSDMPEWQIPFIGQRAEAFAGSPELVRDLAQTHQIVYLTARDDAFDAKTREFLSRRGFPDGPVLFNDLGFCTQAELEQLIPRNHANFKEQVLRQLQAAGLNVALGIGNAETDAQAYEAVGIPSYIRTDEAGNGTSFRFQDYADLRSELQRAGTLPASSGLVGGLRNP